MAVIMVMDADGGLFYEFYAAGIGSSGNVDVEDGSLDQTGLQGLCEQLPGQFGGSQERLVTVLGVLARNDFQGKGDGGDSEESGLDGSSDGSGVNYVYSYICASVQSGNDQLRGSIEQLSDCELDAVSGSTADGPSGEGLVYLSFGTEEGFVNGQGVSGGGLGLFGGHYGDLAEGEQ